MRRVLAGGSIRRPEVSEDPLQISWSVLEGWNYRAAQNSMEDLFYAYHIKDLKQLLRFQSR